jgi:mono/diheme cytochrome c family protein
MKKLMIPSMVLFLAACNAGPNKTNIEVIDNMMDQITIKSQNWNPKQGDKVQMRVPPEHTVARGHTPYKYQMDAAGAEKQSNPLAGDSSQATMDQGKKYYDIYCGVCHGVKGAGDGTVAEKMPVKPRNLITPEAKAYTDGRIYHAITAGKGVMGSYVTQITDEKTRWAVVNYVRSLQKN